MNLGTWVYGTQRCTARSSMIVLFGKPKVACAELRVWYPTTHSHAPQSASVSR